MRTIRTLAIGMLCTLLLWLPLVAMGGMPSDITPAEMALIPIYCRDTNTFGYGDASSPSPRAAHWVSLMGKGFWGMHHYCWALINLARVERRSTSEVQRRGQREGAVNDIEYSINYGIKESGQEFVMLPELFWKRAVILMSLRRDSEAVQSFHKAIESKQDYWPAYVGVAEFYKSRGDNEKAMEIVEQGLKFVPNSKSLNSLRAELKEKEPKSSKTK